MAAIQIQFKNSGAVAGLAHLGPVGDRAVTRALKRTGVSARAVMASLIAKDTGLRVSRVREDMRIDVPPGGQSVSVSVSGRRIPLIEFRASGPQPTRGRGRSVSATVGQRRSYPGAFIARMGTGHVGVFKRAQTLTRRSKGAWSQNLPIKELFGPSLPQVFTKFLPEGAARAEEALAKNLEHELAFELSKLKE